MVEASFNLKSGRVGIEFTEQREGIERMVFDAQGNVAEIKSIHGDFELSKKHVAHVYTTIPDDKFDWLIRSCYETAEMYMHRLAGESGREAEVLAEALEIVCDVGYEGYKKREDLQGWRKFIPPLENHGLVLYNEVMTGCPKSNNPCIFCNVYGGEKFGVVPLDEFSKREQLLAEYAPIAMADHKKGEVRNHDYAPKEIMGAIMEILHRAPKFFWGNGNLFALKPKDLLMRLEEHDKYFSLDPKIVNNKNGIISAFGHSRYILNHVDFLKEYYKLGLREVWVGVESGDDASLKLMNKSATAREHIEVGKVLREANIRCEATVLFGGIDDKLFEDHIEETVRVISEMKPSCVYFTDVVVHEGTKLNNLVNKGKIIIPTKKTPRELAWANISGVPTWMYDIPV